LKVLCFHQSAEMYGSDKTLLQLIQYASMHHKNIEFIVVLPNKGPLSEKLSPYCKLYYHDVIKIERKNLSLSYLFSLPSKIIKVNKLFNKIKKENGPVDLVYTNTLALLAGVIIKFFNRRLIHLTHVHEIIEKPKLVAQFLPKLFGSSSELLVFNSECTQRWFCSHTSVKIKKNKVIYNGVDVESHVRTRTLPHSQIKLALVGRINSWKGHSLMLEAANILKSQQENFTVDFYGDVYNNDLTWKNQLLETIDKYQLTKLVTFHGFIQSDSFWSDIDILVVPSILPEPFGMVAIEAMSRGIPVVGANHGGLSEILADNYGIKFTPCDATSLTNSLKQLMCDQTYYSIQSKNAIERIRTSFSTEKYASSLLGEINKVIQNSYEQ
jgi:glycosyltransferase involved in cell wall biosynthesis